MKMRELEKLTGVNRETIRVYLREGLLPEPTRRAKNSADYDERHVRAINAVRALKRGSAMTLPQIKAAIAGKQGGRHVGAQNFAHLEELVSARVGVQKKPINLNSLVRRYPRAREDARTLEKIGIIEILRGKSDDMVSVSDAGLIGIWARMREAGFDEEHGFPPDILAYYVEAAELVAGNEARLFLEKVDGKLSDEEAARMLEIALPSMLEFFGIIRQRLFLRNIREETAINDQQVAAAAE